LTSEKTYIVDRNGYCCVWTDIADSQLMVRNGLFVKLKPQHPEDFI